MIEKERAGQKVLEIYLNTLKYIITLVSVPNTQILFSLTKIFECMIANPQPLHSGTAVLFFSNPISLSLKVDEIA